MTELMRRRRALMGQKAASPIPVGFVNGTYADGKAIVTNGTTIEFNNPTQYAKIEFPFTESLQVASTVEIKPSDGLGTARFYFTVNGTDMQIGGNSHQGGTWDSLSTSGTITAFIVAPRTASYAGTITFSLKIDDEVIF